MSEKSISNNIKGFTIIELMLVLALTGTLFVAVIASTSGTMSRRRYTDAVQDAYDTFLTAYSNTLYPQIQERDTASFSCSIGSAGSTGYRGQSDCVVYGTLIQIYYDGSITQDRTRIQQAIIIGRDPQNDTTTACLHDKSKTIANMRTDADIIKCVGADIIHYESKSGTAYGQATMNDVIIDKSTIWGSSLQLISDGDVTINGNSYSANDIISSKDTSAYIILFRSPNTGMINTYIRKYTPLKQTIGGVNKAIDLTESLTGDSTWASSRSLSLASILSNSSDFSNLDGIGSDSIDFCVKSDGDSGYGGGKRMIRISRSTTNSTGVKLYGMDSEENRCNKK